MNKIKHSDKLGLVQKTVKDFLTPPQDEYVVDPTQKDHVDVAYLEMAAVGGGFMSIKLAVWGNEGNYPHFHFYKGVKPNAGIPNKGKGGGCILFKEAKYFLHGTHKDTMNRNEIEALIEFLKSTHEIGITVWKYMIFLWNDNNPNSIQVDPDTEIPEYYSNMPNIKKK